MSRADTRRCSSSTRSVRRGNQRARQAAHPLAPQSRWCSARPSSSPRIELPFPHRRTPWPPPNTRPCNASHVTTWSRRPASTPAARTRAHRQSLCLDPQHRPVGARPRPTPPRSLAGLASRSSGFVRSTGLWCDTWVFHVRRHKPAESVTPS